MSLVEEIENKHEKIVELEKKLDSKQRTFGELKSCYNFKAEEKTDAHDLYLVVKSEVDDIEIQISDLNKSIEKLVEEKDCIKLEIQILEEKKETNLLKREIQKKKTKILSLKSNMRSS